MQSERVRNLLKEHVFERDRLELATGDVLDVKAGLLLVMLIFLAGQAETLFQGQVGLGMVQRSLEWISLLGLISGGILSIVQLLPKKYSVLSSPIKYGKWLDDLRKHYSEQPDADALVLGLAEHTSIVQATERFEVNSAINKRKVTLAKWCFYCVIASLAANMLALTLRHLFPLYR